MKRATPTRPEADEVTLVRSLQVIMQLLGRLRSRYCVLFLVAASLSAAEGILHPLLIKSIFDQAVIQHDFSRFAMLTVTYLCLGLFINVIGSVITLWNKSLDNRVLATLSRRLLAAYYEREYGVVLRQGQGYFINRVYGDLREGLVPMLVLAQTLIKQGVLLVCSSLVLVYLSWRAFMLLVAIIPVSAAIGTVMRRRIRALTAQEREEDGAVLAILNKALSAFRMTRGFRLFARTADAFDNRLVKYFSTVYLRYKALRIFQALNDSTMVISDFLSLFVGALFVLKRALSFGAYLAFINTFWRTVNALTQIFSQVAEFHSLCVIVERIGSFLASSGAVYYEVGRSLSVKELSFSYGERSILKNVSLNISPGEKVVIIGPNGCGKTTLANILSGYLAPSQGTVVLPQEISSLTLPIAFPPLKVKELAVDAELLIAFDLQQSATLEAFADELSAGQQQKLAIALALSQKADAYIIDEPLASLDRESARTALKVLFDRTEEKTLVLILHAPVEEVRHRVDRIIDLSAILEFAEVPL